MSVVQSNGTLVIPHPTCMESVNRVAKFPVVESTIQTATDIYGKVKDFNSLTNWTLSAAENTVNMAVEAGKPIAKNFEGPIRKVDDVLCTGLDYVESKVPAVKLPSSEILLQIYNSTKNYVNNTVYPVVDTARSYADPAIKTAKDILEPALEMAKTAIEPAVEKAKNMVDPYMQPAFDKAHAIKDNVMHKVDEYLHRGHNHEDDSDIECEECIEIRKQMEESRLKQQKEQNQDQQNQDQQNQDQQNQEQKNHE